VALIVSVEVPSGVLVVVLIVKVELPGVQMGLAENEARAPAVHSRPD
jgi:hypothetical protein